MARGKYGVSSVVDTPYNRFAEDKARKAAAYTPEGRATLEAEKNAPDPKQVVGNDLHGVIIGILILAGVAVLLLGYAHAHWPIPAYTGLGGGSLGWTDAPAFYVDSQGNYVNEGSVILYVIGALLLVMSGITKAKFGGAKSIAALAGLSFIVLATTIFLWQWPWG